MAKPGYKLMAVLTVAALSVAFAEEAKAQQPSNPNMGHFYMARQQIQITDDSPVINYRGNGGGGQPGAQAPNRPMPLPRAGFQRFSQQLPSYSNTLPAVNNGVPKAPPPAPAAPQKKGKSGKAGKYKAPAKPSATASTPAPTNRMKTYSPYKGYDPKQSTAAHTPTAGHTSNGGQTKTNVRGSVLHWARGQH